MGVKDVKLLWGRAANRCALCQIELAHDGAASGAVPIGEQAHIVAEEHTGPRGASALTPDERNSYANLILLCPTCHTKIDKAPADFPIERLHHFKTMHELWVRESLGQGADDPDTVVYAKLIDDVVMAADLEHWNQWSGSATSPGHIWRNNPGARFFALGQQVQAAIWPRKFTELEASIVTLSRVLEVAFAVFSQHSSEQDGVYRSDGFHLLMANNPEKQELLRAQFVAWSAACDELLREATRAANWFAQCVRRDVNPLFFLLHGKFLLCEGPGFTIEAPGPSLVWRSTLPEYSAHERSQLPAYLEDRLLRILAEYERLRSAA